MDKILAVGWLGGNLPFVCYVLAMISMGIQDTMAKINQVSITILPEDESNDPKADILNSRDIHVEQFGRNLCSNWRRKTGSRKTCDFLTLFTIVGQKCQLVGMDLTISMDIKSADWVGSEAIR